MPMHACSAYSPPGNRIRHRVGGVCLEVNTGYLVVNKCTKGSDPRQEFLFNKWAWGGSPDAAPVDVVPGAAMG